MASKVAHQTLKQGVKSVRPLLSTDKAQAKRRVLNLYKAWYRQIPYTGLLWSMTMTVRTSLWSRRWDLVLVAIFGVFICIRGGYKAKSDYEKQISKRLYPGMLLSMHKHKQERISAPCRFNSSLNFFRDDPALSKRGLSWYGLS